MMFFALAGLLLAQSDDGFDAEQAAAKLKSTGHAYTACMTENAHWMPAGKDRPTQVQQLSETCGGQYNSFMNNMFAGQSSEVRSLGRSIAAPLQQSLANIVLGPGSDGGIVSNNNTKIVVIDNSGEAARHVRRTAADARVPERSTVSDFTVVQSGCGGGLSSPTDPAALSCGGSR